MTHDIPVGQMIGGCVEHSLWILGGAYLAWIRPRRLQRAVRSGKISEDQRQASLKRIPLWFGYVFIIGGALLMLMLDLRLF
jgi:threonine/homoserine/homoserine lactone efflux protein